MARRNQPDGHLFAIGDIHGCPDELGVMLKAIAPRKGDTAIFIGDYVDRGPSSRDVIEQLIDLGASGAETVFLKGNHEDMMLAFLGMPGHYGDAFLHNGGIHTLDSYGIGGDAYEAPDRVGEKIPERHLEFLRSLATRHVHPPYLFVHAGVAPSRPLDEQDEEDLLWIRQEFIFNPHNLGSIVVFGHTPMRDVLSDLPYKIGLDTGLVYGGKLTCIEFNEGVCYQVGRGYRHAASRSIVVR